jgi:hypothetical protein
VSRRGKLKPNELAAALYECFSWGATPQGAEYWATVFRNLMDLEVRERAESGQPILNSVVYGEPEE